MFKFKQSSWFIQYWVYLPVLIGMGYIPAQTNLCIVFWKTVLIIPLFVIVLCILGPPIALAVGIGWSVYKLYKWLKRHGMRVPDVGFCDVMEEGCDVIAEFFVARKKKWCPIIVITNEDKDKDKDKEEDLTIQPEYEDAVRRGK